MADRDETPTPAPVTLAGLWLKSVPAARPEQGDAPSLAPSSAGLQMGLLFTSPAETSEPPSQQKPGRRGTKSAAREAIIAPAATPAAALPAVRSNLAPSVVPSHAAAERRIWSVRSVVTDIRQHVETGYADIWVEGEISNCRPAPSGHIYFTLKDGEAQLPVVLFLRQAILLRFRPHDGLAILARGRISVYESRGQLQLIAEMLEPRGAGLLQLAFDRLKARLLAEGLFDAGRKRPLPAFPRSIGVITSAHGAVLHDILTVIRRRHGRLNLLIYPALMQGPECAASVAAGLRFFNRDPGRADLILIARGGGSPEDLAGFNVEWLARAISASTLPVVSAIGHETDFTIADFVADLRAPTPSAAAELITSAQHRIEERVEQLQSRVRRAIRYQLVLARQRFTALSTAQIQSRVQALIGRRGQRLDDLRRGLDSAAARRLRTLSARLAALSARIERHNPSLRLALARRRLESADQCLVRASTAVISTRATFLRHAGARLEALSPLAVLSRGYALVYSADGRLLRSSTEAHPGETIRARLAQGSLAAEVTGIDPKPNVPAEA